MRQPRKSSVAILISGHGSNLQALLEAVVLGLPVDIKVVISNELKAYGLIRARKAGVASEIIEHKNYDTRAAFDDQLAETLESYKVDWILLAGFMRRLTGAFVQRFAGRIINIHPSLLPKYKGLRTHEAVLAAGEKEHGVSIHFVSAQLDGGPVICQARLKVQNDETLEGLRCRVHELEHQLYPQVLAWLAQGLLQCVDDKVVFKGRFLPSKGLDLSDVMIKS